jgi:hypothetical protein
MGRYHFLIVILYDMMISLYSLCLCLSIFVSLKVVSNLVLMFAIYYIMF